MKSRGAPDLPMTGTLLRERVGLDVRHVEPAEQARRMRRCMERAGFHSDAAYAAHLRNHSDALLELASALTVGETYFYRDPEQLRELTQIVLPQLLLERSADAPLWVWSAGCATGEEAYTLAMLLDQCGLLERAHIVGSDVSEQSLARAREGLYSSWSLRAIPRSMLRRYFTSLGDKVQVCERLRSRVRFERQSLTDTRAPLPGGVDGFDLILCRNVLMYLTREACQQASRRLAHALLPGGSLLTSPSDDLLELPTLWTRVTTAAGVRYRRLDPTRVPVALPALERELPPPLLPTLEPYLELRRPSPPPPPPTPRQAPEPRQEPALLLQGGDTQETIEQCRARLSEEPLSDELHLLLASLLMEVDRDTEAELSLRTALYLNRELVMGYFLLALVHQRRGEPERAARLYRRVAKLCRELPVDEPVRLGDGVSHGILAHSAEQNARALEEAGSQP